MPVIIYVPIDTPYLAEFINDFLTVYNTVSIQATEDCNVRWLEQLLAKSKQQLGV